jgi:CRISPR-associated endoribonuclease Cas6
LDTFCLYAYRFEFQALNWVRFAPGGAANAFRGAFGHILRQIACRPECEGARSCRWREECAYARLFEPAWPDGPSGFANPPRPFVIRAAALDGRRFAPGTEFSVDVHVFDVGEPVLEYLVLVFLQLASEGIGTGRGKIELRHVHALTAGREPGARLYDQGRGVIPEGKTLIELPLLVPEAEPVKAVRLRFLTPTELKSGGEILDTLPFAAVFARARDRVATLASLYSDAEIPYELDFSGLARRATAVEMLSADLRQVPGRRVSSRTGEAHPLGGLVGEARYAGEMAEFLPVLRAAYWTGIGRQTVWGKGVLDVDVLA